MPILDHTIVAAHDKQRSASFLSDIVGLPSPISLGHFTLVWVGGTTTLDFVDIAGPVTSQHYALLVTEAEFDAIFGGVRDRTSHKYRHRRGAPPAHFDAGPSFLLSIRCSTVGQRRIAAA